MKRPNPYPSRLMTPAERRLELCSLLALGLGRLKKQNTVQATDSYREISLHNSADQSIHVTSTHRRKA